jgi:1,4-dihydroxy-2-naphthoate octaprenyltransferase
MVLAAVPVGCLATALLVVNNLRDIPTDAAAGKRTLAVRLGDGRTRGLYSVLAAFAGPFAVAPIRAVVGGARGPALIPVLQATARAQLLTGVVLAAALWGLR